MSMMSDHEEDLDGFPLENKEKTGRIYGWSTSRRVDISLYSSGITAKIPPDLNGSTSWFRYEEETKRGPALKNRLVGDAELCRGLLNRESLRAADGVKYFRNTLRPHFIKGAQSVCLWRFYQFTRARRGHVKMVKWIGKFSLPLKRSSREC